MVAAGKPLDLLEQLCYTVDSRPPLPGSVVSTVWCGSGAPAPARTPAPVLNNLPACSRLTSGVSRFAPHVSRMPFHASIANGSGQSQKCDSAERTKAIAGHLDNCKPRLGRASPPPPHRSALRPALSRARDPGQGPARPAVTSRKGHVLFSVLPKRTQSSQLAGLHLLKHISRANRTSPQGFAGLSPTASASGGACRVHPRIVGDRSVYTAKTLRAYSKSPAARKVIQAQAK